MNFEVRHEASFPHEGQHHVRGALFKCTDWRTRREDQSFDEKILGDDFDLYALPSPPKQLLDDPEVSGKLLSWLRKVSVGLHAVNHVLLIEHWDCGAHGGSEACADASEEEALHRRYLEQVSELVKREFPDLLVTVAFSKFEGGKVSYYVGSESAVETVESAAAV